MATETVSYQIKIDADTKSLKTLEQELKDINKETLELKETNQLFKEELIELENRYKKLPKTALGAKKKLKEQITDLKGAIKENNLALQNFTIDKQQKKQLINDFKEVNNEVGHSVENFAGFGAAIGETVAGFMLLSGASEENTEKLEHAIGTVMAFKGVAEGTIHAQKIWNTTIKNSTLLTTINSTATKMAGVVQKLFTGSVNQTSFAFKGLKKAIIATGIGALVVAVGLLIANFDKLKGAINGVSKAQKDALDDQQKAVDLADERLNNISDQENILKLQGKSEREILNMKINAVSAAINERKIRLGMQREELKAGIEAEKRNKRILETGIEVVMFVPRMIAKFVDLEIKAFNFLINEMRKIPFVSDLLGDKDLSIDFSVSSTADDLISSAAGLIFDPEETSKKAEETLKASEKGIKDLENQQAGFKLSIQSLDEKELKDKSKRNKKEDKDAEKRREKQLRDELKHRQNLKAIKDEFLNELEKETDLFNEQFMTEQDIEIQAVEEKYFRLKELAIQNGIDTAELVYNEEFAIQEIKDKFAKEEKEKQEELELNKKEKRQKELEDEIALQDAKLSMASQGIGALINLNNAFAKDNEKSQKRAFERNKKLQIAQAIIQTYQGANAIFASAAANPATVLFPAQPFIAAGIAIVSGLANVAQISKQQFQSSSSGGGGNVSAPNFGLGGGGGISAPSLEPTNQSTLVPQDDEGNLMQVFVTETDITNTQNKVNVIETQATF